MKKVKEILQLEMQKDYESGAGHASNQDYANRKRLMKFNRFFAQYKVFTRVYAAAAGLVMVLLVYLFNRLEAMSLKGLFTDGKITYSKVSIWHTIQSS
ncbi:hypothetical protein, partial [Pseudomonas aeruginosa]